MPGSILAEVTSDNTASGAILTAVFPVLIFIVVAAILYMRFSRPHRRVPARAAVAPGTVSHEVPDPDTARAAAVAAGLPTAAGGGAAEGAIEPAGGPRKAVAEAAAAAKESVADAATAAKEAAAGATGAAAESAAEAGGAARESAAKAAGAARESAADDGPSTYLAGTPTRRKPEAPTRTSPAGPGGPGQGCAGRRRAGRSFGGRHGGRRVTQATSALPGHGSAQLGVPVGGRRPARLVARSLFLLTKPRIIELLLVTTVPTMLLAKRGLPVAVAARGHAARRRARGRLAPTP